MILSCRMNRSNKKANKIKSNFQIYKKLFYTVKTWETWHWIL